MRRRSSRLTLALSILVLVAIQWSLAAQSPPEAAKRPIGYDVMDYWWSIGGTQLSNDGRWVAYALTSQGADGELVVYNVATGREFRHPRGTSPAFSADSRFCVFTIAQSKAEEEKEREQGERRGEGQAGEAAGGRGSQAERNQPRTGMGIMSLSDGKVTTVDRVGSFRMPEESAGWLAYYKGTGGGGGGRGAGARGRGAGPAPAATRQARPAAGQRGEGDKPREKRKDPGSELVLRNLGSGEEITIPEVTEYLFDKRGGWLAYATSSTEAAKDGAFARQMSDGSVKTLLSGRGHYKSLVFDEAGKQVAFLSDQAEYEKPVSPYRLYLWTPADTTAREVVSGSTSGMPSGMVVADAAPRFSRDGAQLFLATAPPPEPEPDPDERRPAAIPVDVWSWKDPVIQPMQRVRAEQERNRNYRAVVHVAGNRFVQLATPDLPNVNPGDDPNRALGTSDVPYRMEVSWDQGYNDTYLVDLGSGKAQKILEHWGSGGTALSPGGKYVLYFDEENGHWFTYRVADGTRVNLTEKLGVSFQQENDTPSLPGPYGAGGWTEGDASVLLYDEFDIWEVKPDGSGARMITNGEGRKERIAFRYRSLDPEERIVPTTGPMLLSATDDTTRATGFYRVNFAGTAAPEKIVMLDKAFGRSDPTKAKKAETVIFTLSRFDEFPDLWMSPDTSFRDMKKISNANPQQAQYVWGKSEIIDYWNVDGKLLRAILTKPENFDPKKKYPLMVYIYEQLTQGLHSYSAPNVGTSINVTRYVSNGYVVLRPDIVYDTGYPGESAEKCVIPAVNTVVAMGFIDPERIGIQGHSWGGYQITHLITRTNMFAAVQAGASVTNMTSAYGGIRWGTGMVRQFQYEKTQSRIGAPPWDAPLQFIENSPIFWVEKVNTPYLTIHNDEDDAVPWYQGIEFNMALRRLGKEAYMFVYNGERHGLRNRDNMKHWTVHQDEFFDHYLLGKPRPKWMDEGVSFLDRGKRDVSPLFKRKTS